jgi:hypothetical protein
MKRIAVSLVLQTLLTTAATSRDMIREVPFIEQARPGMAYDYIVHVRNVPAIRYNPLVQEDRDRMALMALKTYCRPGRVIEDQKVNTEIWGITSSYPDYLVLVACGSHSDVGDFGWAAARYYRFKELHRGQGSE